MPLLKKSEMVTVNGSSPGIDDLNRIDKLAAVLAVVTKTANYTVKVEESGTVFDTTGASDAVAFTLPAETNKGVFFIFKNVVAQNMAITAPAGKLVGLHNATATTATFQTANQQIGAAALVVCDGAKWHLLNISAGASTVTLS